VTRNAELSDDKNIERGGERFRDFERDRDAAARQREDDDCRVVLVVLQFPGEGLACVFAILELHVLQATD